MKPRTLRGGPYNGQQMHPCPTGRTLSFTAKGLTGHYDAAGLWNNEAKVLAFPGPGVLSGADRTTSGAIGQP